MRRHYKRPYFLPETSENEKTDWIFMGSPGYGAPMHVKLRFVFFGCFDGATDVDCLGNFKIDDVWYPSWQAQIRGQKLWILEPPRECLYTCNRLEVVVSPGEISELKHRKEL